MVLRRGATHYEAISWDDAFALIAGELNSLAHPDEAIFYTSGRTSNEAAFLYQLFVRQFGTNNLPDCSNMCHESSGSALERNDRRRQGNGDARRFRSGRGDFRYRTKSGHESSAHADCAARRRRRMAASWSISIRLPEVGMTRFKHPQEFWDWLGAGTKLADLFLQVRINGDVALLKGIMKAVLEAEERRPGACSITSSSTTTRLGLKNLPRVRETVSWTDIVEQCGCRKRSRSKKPRRRSLLNPNARSFVGPWD